MCLEGRAAATGAVSTITTEEVRRRAATTGNRICHPCWKRGADRNREPWSRISPVEWKRALMRRYLSQVHQERECRQRKYIGKCRALASTCPISRRWRRSSGKKPWFNKIPSSRWWQASVSKLRLYIRTIWGSVVFNITVVRLDSQIGWGNPWKQWNG